MERFTVVVEPSRGRQQFARAFGGDIEAAEAFAREAIEQADRVTIWAQGVRGSRSVLPGQYVRKVVVLV